MFTKRYSTVIVGGGPAALAPLVSASRNGLLDQLLAGGIVVIERQSTIGDGRLGDYAIWSDSTAQTFLTAVTDHVDPRLHTIQSHPLFAELSSMGQGAIPLVKAAELMRLVGDVLRRAIVDSGGLVLVEHEAVKSRRTPDGDWLTSVRCAGSADLIYIRSRTIVLATGGDQPYARLGDLEVAGTTLLPTYADKLVQSDEVLQPEGLKDVFRRIAMCEHPKVVIVGGSTSAMAAADLLLKTSPARFAQGGSITVMHRRPIRIFYRSIEEALADNYRDFGPDDICPLSGFVFRFAGLRLHSRDLLKRILGIGDCPPEPRVVLHQICPGTNAESRALLESADVVVAALGYRPRALALLDENDAEINLMAEVDAGKLVDHTCRILDRRGDPVRNAFGIGLAAGFVPSGALGGEKSFVGQANGLWLWQTAVGALIVDNILSNNLEDEQPASLPPPWMASVDTAGDLGAAHASCLAMPV